jgi:glycosyltransferase involved in cell wall biosynthesis
MRIAIVISSLSCGGAEKNITMLANHWYRKKMDVNIVKLDSSTNEPFFKLDKGINVKSLDSYNLGKKLWKGLFNNVYRIFKLRKVLSEQKVDIVLSFMDKTNIIVTLALFGKNIPVIISERNDPQKNHPGTIWEVLRRKIYPKAGRIILQNESFRDYFNSQLQNNISIIPNAILPPPPKNYTSGDKGLPKKPYLMGIGKLRPQKGFDVLIESFILVKKNHPKWHLVIFGEGEERDNLQRLINKYEMNDSIFLIGKTKTPYFYLYEAEMFILSSRYEGFPNVLCEAMSCGLPSISTDCSPAIKEIVDKNINGVVVNFDVEQIANAICYLIEHPGVRKRIGHSAKFITKKFNIDRISKLWEKEFNLLIGKNLAD